MCWEISGRAASGSEQRSQCDERQRGACQERSRASMQGEGEQRSQRGREPTGGERASVTNASKQAGTREEVSRRAGGEIRQGAGGEKKILSTPPLRRRDGGQGPSECEILKGTQTHFTFIMELESVTLQGLISFFSSMGGMAVFWFLWCPNKRCCQSERVRNACEGDKKTYEAQKRNRFSED